jgi:hypothetical protein
MLNYKAQAIAVINKLEMYARINRFSEQHNALLATPASMEALDLLEYALRRSNNSRTEDNHVYGTYRYFSVLARYNWTESAYFHEMQSCFNELNAYRFPSASSVRAEFSRQLDERREAANQPHALVSMLASILCNHRPWFHREYFNSGGNMHPAVFKAWDLAEPANWHQLVMEWPHESKQGAHMVAYTRDEKYGEADRQLVLSVSKYLTRHFPTLNSNVIRDISGMYAEAKFGIVRTMPEMLDIVMYGPSSCMSGEAHEFSASDGHHPYEVYDPQYGWHMAYIKEGNKYTGRALLNDNVWVRTYRGRPDSRYSDTDERLNSWLREQGYSKADGWGGFSVARISVSNSCGILAPYIDGRERDLSERDSGRFKIVNNGEGEYHCSETNGSADERNPCTCACCGTHMSEDDSHGVGRHCDEQVCEDCYSNDYTLVYGRRGEEYSVPNSDAIEVDGEWYHDEWLSDNDIVELHDGSYAHSDNTVYVESEDAHYRDDDERVVYTQAGEHEMRSDCVELANGEWCLTDEAWCCGHTGDYYTNDEVAGVNTVCGKLVHPDHADQYQAQQELPLE